jgi:3-dehydroquinate synthase
VPTTLLAMIDASIGGKTGVDVPLGKNLLGAFHQPRLVVLDLDALATLPAPQFANGMAEAVKHGVIADADYFAVLEREGPAVRAREAAALERTVARSVAIKAEVVAADEREAGRRAILNFGHTIGHAIETTSGFQVRHGEAVAIGMVLESRLAEEAGIAAAGTAARIARVLTLYTLPVQLPDSVGVDGVLEAMRHDKKAREGSVRFALPRRIGEMAGGEQSGWTVSVAEVLMRAVLTRHGSE